jgi:hypothetical protein
MIVRRAADLTGTRHKNQDHLRASLFNRFLSFAGVTASSNEKCGQVCGASAQDPFRMTGVSGCAYQ